MILGEGPTGAWSPHKLKTIPCKRKCCRVPFKQKSATSRYCGDECRAAAAKERRAKREGTNG